MINSRYSTDTCQVVLRLNHTDQNQIQHLTWHYEMLQKYSIVRMLVQTGQDMVTTQQQIHLRLVTKAEKPVEDTLVAIIMILKSLTADITWQKGVKRQLANLDRFIEEIQLFDKINLTEEDINLITANY
ncbi:unnamed protein product [Adineta steineri]|uniref:Uncharacterized protein n=1 Tax=Adineta steineri TaxID=433720 RepID=A0A815MMB9_9BILA|nr:unnamed protein product [Adineta steineri]CAF1419847.1 unnamed protein product [Adineta steineri]CAF1420271.1 unnamed protein product [Adineta steineri]